MFNLPLTKSSQKRKTTRPGLPNLLSVAGQFHMMYFIAGHKRFDDATMSYCDVTNHFILISFMR